MPGNADRAMIKTDVVPILKEHILPRAMSSKSSLKLWYRQCRTWSASTMYLTKNQGEAAWEDVQGKTWSWLELQKQKSGRAKETNSPTYREKDGHTCVGTKGHTFPIHYFPVFNVEPLVSAGSFLNTLGSFLLMLHLSFLEIFFSSLN